MSHRGAEVTELGTQPQGFVSGYVSILGPPNAGKSTLLNTLVGSKVAIVTDKPQTTRQTLQGVVTRSDAQVIFLDTPGIHRPASRLNQRMMQEVEESLRELDLLLLLADASRSFGPGDALALEWVKKAGTPAFLVLNKIDLLARKELLLPRLAHYQKLHNFQELVPVSARTGENTGRLLENIIRYLPPGPQYFPPEHITDQPARFLAGEIIREKAIQLTRQELPFATAVIVDRFERTPRLLRVHAVIFVERQGQKGILIGARGERLKKIAVQAREEIEKTFGVRVYLEVFIKVHAHWRESSSFLKGLDWHSMVGGEDAPPTGKA